MRLSFLKDVYVALSVAWGSGLLIVSAIKFQGVEPAGVAFGNILGYALVAPIFLSSLAMVRKKYRGIGFFKIYWQWNYWIFCIATSRLVGYEGEYDPKKAIMVFTALMALYLFQSFLAKKISSSTE